MTHGDVPVPVAVAATFLAACALAGVGLAVLADRVLRRFTRPPRPPLYSVRSVGGEVFIQNMPGKIVEAHTCN